MAKETDSEHTIMRMGIDMRANEAII